MVFTSLVLSAAFAGNPSTVEGVAWEIDDLQARYQGVLIVGVEAAEPERFVRRLEEEVSTLDVLLIPLRPSTVDPNRGRWTLEHVLRVRNQPCGLLVQEGISGWSTVRVGQSCDAPLAAAVLEPATFISAVPEAGVSVFVPSPPTRWVDPGYVRAYQRQAFSRTSGLTGTWEIQDGWGETWSTRDFAQEIGDDMMIQRLRRERIVAAAGGLGLMGLGTAMIAGSGFGDRFGMGPLDVGPLEMHGSNYQDRRNRAFVGAGVALMGLTVPLGISARQENPAHYYSGVEADMKIDRYNEELRAEWGLSEADLAAY